MVVVYLGEGSALRRDWSHNAADCGEHHDLRQYVFSQPASRLWRLRHIRRIPKYPVPYRSLLCFCAPFHPTVCKTLHSQRIWVSPAANQQSTVRVSMRPCGCAHSLDIAWSGDARPDENGARSGVHVKQCYSPSNAISRCDRATVYKTGLPACPHRH